MDRFNDDRLKLQLIGFFAAHGQVKPNRIVITVTRPGIGAHKVPVLQCFKEVYGGNIYTWTMKDGREQVTWEIGSKRDVRRFAQFFIDNCTLPSEKIEKLKSRIG